MTFQKIEEYQTLEIGSGERQHLRMKNEITLFESRFHFMKDNCGLRPGKVHLFLGTTGTGKTTLVRSIEIDSAEMAPIGKYSSEEDLEDTKYLLSKRVVHNDVLKNIFFLDEKSILKKINSDDLNGFFTYLYNWLIAIKAKAFFFDNLTSSFYEGKPFKVQIKFYELLRAMIEALNIPCVLVAHTRFGVKDSQSELIMPDDIRGPKHPSNKSEYLYIYQRFKISLQNGGERLTAVVRVAKSRLHNNGSEIYILGFDANKKEYLNDKKINFSEFNDIFMKRLRLGKK